MNSEYQQQFNPDFSGQTVIDCLAKDSPFSKQQLKAFMQNGCVWLQTIKQAKPNRIRRAKKTLNLTDKLFFYYNAKVMESRITAPSLVADETSFSVWYKPKGVLCQGSKWGDHTTINRWIEMHYLFNGNSRPAIIVHRLDKDTDGLMLIAHSLQAAKQLTQLFSERKIEKKYQARVVGKFHQETTFDSNIEGKTAITHAKLIEYNASENTSLLAINIETGRKHQIRQHLSTAGFPIVGDRLYGKPCENIDLQLTSVFLKLKLDDIRYQYTLPAKLAQVPKF